MSFTTEKLIITVNRVNSMVRPQKPDTKQLIELILANPNATPHQLAALFFRNAGNDPGPKELRKKTKAISQLRIELRFKGNNLPSFPMPHGFAASQKQTSPKNHEKMAKSLSVFYRNNPYATNREAGQAMGISDMDIFHARSLLQNQGVIIPKVKKGEASFLHPQTKEPASDVDRIVKLKLKKPTSTIQQIANTLRVGRAQVSQGLHSRRRTGFTFPGEIPPRPRRKRPR